jgi:gluconokinase
VFGDPSPACIHVACAAARAGTAMPVAHGARDVVIGVDLGTTSAKAVAFTTDATAHASGTAPYELDSPRPGYAEQDPEVVAGAAWAALREVSGAARNAGLRVAGVAVSAAMHSLIGLDARGRALTPAITWADSRAAEQAARLRSSDLASELHRRTGTPVHPMSPLVKLRWFAETEPEVASAVRHWVGIKEYALRRLTGELVVDHGTASGTGLFDLRRESWDPEALGYARVTPEQLPALVPTTAVVRLNDEAAGLTGLPAGTPVVVGGGDGPLANLGLGAIRPGAVACSIGTSGALRAAADAPRLDDRGRVYCYVIAEDRYVIGGAVNNGGIVLDWLADAVAPDLATRAVAAGRSDAAALLDVAARAPAGSGGLLFLPYLLGERAPLWAGRPRGVYLGLSRDHRREHLLRAPIEGVCLQLAVVLAVLLDAGVEIRDIRATGGFSRSVLWRRILAAAFGRPVGFAASPEGSSLGAALLGMVALGLLGSLDRAAELVAVADTEEPDAAEAEVYARLLPIFDAAYDALAGSFAALAALEGALPLAHPDRPGEGRPPSA